MNRIKSNGTARNRTAAARVGMLGAIGAALFAGSVDAAVVVHDNTDGTFKWTVSIDNLGNEDILGTFLDITKSPSAQTGEMKAGAFGRWFVPRQTSSEPSMTWVSGVDAVDAARASKYIKITWNGNTQSYPVLRTYAEGDSVSQDADWKWGSPYFFHDIGAEIPDKFIGTPGIGTLAYLGVRLKASNDNYRYGWILLDQYKNPLMWAYETELNTAIEIPVPGPGVASGVLIALMSAVAPRRRASIR